MPHLFPLGKSMNIYTQEVLLSEVKSISHAKHDEKKFCAIFHLEKGISLKGEITHDRYTFTPVQQSQLPEIKQIIWKKELIFGGCGIIPKVTFTDLCPQVDRKEYAKLLVPEKIYLNSYNFSHYEYRYLPLLENAEYICMAWCELQKFTQKVKLARQNFKDVLALKKARYDLREYY
jgi:hypothetical protein